MCARITANGKCKEQTSTMELQPHQPYDHWHSQVYSTGGQNEGAKRPGGDGVPSTGRSGAFGLDALAFAHIVFSLISIKYYGERL